GEHRRAYPLDVPHSPPFCRELIRRQLGPRRRCADDRVTRTRGFMLSFRRQRDLILPIWATQLPIRRTSRIDPDIWLPSTPTWAGLLRPSRPGEGQGLAEDAVPCFGANA